MANNVTHSNWADYFATTPTDWTFDNTNRVYQYTGSEVYITPLNQYTDIPYWYYRKSNR